MASFQSPKNFITEIERGSTTIEDINDEFRHVASKLVISSFYESRATILGTLSFKVVTKDSAVLGYEKESSRELAADHHGLCKFSSREDPNYITVRNTLINWVSKLQRNGMQLVGSLRAEETAKIERLLCITPAYEEDLQFFRALRSEGTCRWMLHQKWFEGWLNSPEKRPIVAQIAPPASGKSVLSAYLIDYLQSSGSGCQYFFFRSGDQNKRSINSFFKSVMLQLATTNESVKQKLLQVAERGGDFKSSSYAEFYKKVFEFGIVDAISSEPMFWVLDSVDESESSKILLSQLLKVQGFIPSLRILFTCRNSDSLPLIENPSISVIQTEASKTQFDISLYLKGKLEEMSGSSQLKDRIFEDVSLLLKETSCGFTL